MKWNGDYKPSRCGDGEGWNGFPGRIEWRGREMLGRVGEKRKGVGYHRGQEDKLAGTLYVYGKHKVILCQKHLSLIHI